jgi:GNAT superfamily N-acetyltransferase
MEINIHIREAVPSDIDELVGLLAELFSIEADFTFNDSLQRQGLTMMLDNPEDRCILIAEVNGNVVGMGSVQVLVSTAEGGLAGLVEDIVVSEPYRRKGIGALLLTSLEKWASQRGLTRLQLLADQDNAPALEFYEKMKWKTTWLICLRKK